MESAAWLCSNSKLTTLCLLADFRSEGSNLLAGGSDRIILWLGFRGIAHLVIGLCQLYTFFSEKEGFVSVEAISRIASFQLWFCYNQLVTLTVDRTEVTGDHDSPN